MKFTNCAAMLILGMVKAGIGMASPADYVYTPTVEYGEKEVDFKVGSARLRDGTLTQATSVGFGFSALETWFTEIYLKQESTGNQIANLLEWENKFQFTETGKYSMDIGFITELEAPLNSKIPWELKFGPLFQTENGKIQLNGNMYLERAFGVADESGVPFATNFSYQLQVKYRYQSTLEYGLQGMGDMGKWNDWNKRSDQVHRVGPAIFGKLSLGNRHAIRYNVAWLFGASTAAPDHTFRMQLEYEY